MPWLSPIATALPCLCSDDPWLPTTVQAWAEADHLFAQQMDIDQYLPPLLEQLKEDSFDLAKAAKDPYLSSGILTITRALIVRGHYALSQKMFIVDKLKRLEEGPIKNRILEQVDEVDHDVMCTLVFLEQYQKILKPNLDNLIGGLHHCLMMGVPTLEVGFDTLTLTTAPMSEGSADESDDEEDKDNDDSE